jgi:hypothetical protein
VGMHQRPPFRSSEQLGLVIFTPIRFGPFVNARTREFKTHTYGV